MQSAQLRSGAKLLTIATRSHKASTLPLERQPGALKSTKLTKVMSSPVHPQFFALAGKTWVGTLIHPQYFNVLTSLIDTLGYKCKLFPQVRLRWWEIN